MELLSSQLAVNLQAIPHSLSLISMGYWISVSVLGIRCQFDTDPISKLAWVSGYRYCSALYCLSLISLGYSVPDADVNPMSKLVSVIDVVNVDGNGAIASQWWLILAKDLSDSMALC